MGVVQTNQIISSSPPLVPFFSYATAVTTAPTTAITTTDVATASIVIDHDLADLKLVEDSGGRDCLNLSETSGVSIKDPVPANGSGQLPSYDGRLILEADILETVKKGEEEKTQKENEGKKGEEQKAEEKKEKKGGEEKTKKKEEWKNGGKKKAVEKNDGKEWKPKFMFSMRQGQIDCKFYLTGDCKFGSNCKFNHPQSLMKFKTESKMQEVEPVRLSCPRNASFVHINVSYGVSSLDSQAQSKKQPKVDQAILKKQSETNQADKTKQKEGTPKMDNHKEFKVHTKKQKEATRRKDDGKEFKNHLCRGKLKFEKSPKVGNSPGPKESTIVELNFLDLPLRPGAKDCSYYMRTGNCPSGINCKYHHPDPTATFGPDPSSICQNGESAQQITSGMIPRSATPLFVAQSSSEKTSLSDASTSYSIGVNLSQGFYSSSEWNGYSEHIEEFPDGPGQPECQHYIGSGVCQLQSSCKFCNPEIHLEEDIVWLPQSQPPSTI